MANHEETKEYNDHEETKETYHSNDVTPAEEMNFYATCCNNRANALDIESKTSPTYHTTVITANDDY